MAENRKASAQSLNELTFDGDSEVGSGNGTLQTLATGYDSQADLPRGGHPWPRLQIGPLARCSGSIRWQPISATEEVLAANQAFYDAFEARDLDAMSDVWERSERATCTHPGWATLRGWGKVASSFFTLFTGPQRVQFVLTDAHVEVDGGIGWVSLDENLLGDQGGATVAALNMFVYDAAAERWRLVCHHGSVVSAEGLTG